MLLLFFSFFILTFYVDITQRASFKGKILYPMAIMDKVMITKFRKKHKDGLLLERKKKVR